ncbi:glycosyltransferase family 4 protein [Cerasicoccus maritimus]|uniref:glycosyltransferase family 4 protein n=1 Tax=Cerasicoccus maritimus TaxID=490089 RepID=UPI0028525F82|nr:glycosyltransferase family 4 protein [Cerasicoccus maritimus]
MGAYGGIEAFVLELGRYLNQCNSYAVKLCFKLVSGYKIDVRLEQILTESPLNYTVVQKCSRELYHEIRSADIVHMQNASPDVAMLSRLCGAKLVQTIHNHLHDRGFLRTCTWKFGAALADLRIYNSNFVQDSWTRHQTPRDLVIPTVSEFTQNFAPFETRRGFVFLSRLIPNKGADTLIQAYSAADIPHQDWPLHILGDGPLRQELEAIAAQGPSSIHFAGFISEAEKQKTLRHARWLIAPPNTREDMGLTPLEARANGIPVIATRDGGLAESAGADALICTPGNVSELRALIEKAAAMPSAEYEKRSHGAFESLKTHLKPMSIYPELYQQLLKA